MRITGRFYSADEAEAAAAALNRAPSGIFDVSLDLPPVPREQSVRQPMGFFAGLGAGNSPGLPVPVLGSVLDGGEREHTGQRETSVSVLCRPSEAQRVAAVMRSKGGHRIRVG